MWFSGFDRGAANGRVTSSTLGWGTCLGFRPGPQLGTSGRQLIEMFLSHIDISLLSPFPPL